jgi:hypothetical protein
MGCHLEGCRGHLSDVVRRRKVPDQLDEGVEFTGLQDLQDLGPEGRPASLRDVSVGRESKGLDPPVDTVLDHAQLPTFSGRDKCQGFP